MKTGVYRSISSSGEYYYRSSITYKGKHISLGSYHISEEANQAYRLAGEVLLGPVVWTLDNYPDSCILTFHKWVVLINYRDNGIYFKNPIYLKKNYFQYYIDPNIILKFDIEDLFYYAHHKIQRRGGHLFVADYGMQVNLQSRYGIKNYAVTGRDYVYINGDAYDYRYTNIKVINRYHGVSQIMIKGQPKYIAKIHINGDYLIGRYRTEEEAAIAYNKASLILVSKGIQKNFPQNYIEGMDEIAYAALYQRIRISNKITDFNTP